VPGSPAASGFVDGAAKAIHHVAQIAKVVHDHGIGAVVPSKEDAKKWMHDFKENCLDHAKDCVTHKAQEAADELNRFRKLSRDDQVYAVSSTLGEAAPGMLASAIVPGGGAVLGGVIRTGEKAAGKALLKKAGKEALEEVAEHTDEAAARRLLREAEDRAKKEAEKRAAKEAAEAAEAAEAEAKRTAAAQAKTASETTHATPSRHAPLGPNGEPIDTPRTVFRRGPSGRVDHYQTFEAPSSPRDPRPTILTKRFDGVGDAHKDVPTPHIHEPSKPDGRLNRARNPPRPDELPKGY
jgi:hypothetical protein